MCKNIRNKYISLHGHTNHNNQTFRQTCDLNKSFQVWREVILWLEVVVVVVVLGGEREGGNYNVKL